MLADTDGKARFEPNSVNGKAGWRPVSKTEPCPICNRDHNCSIAINGSAWLCGRIAGSRPQRRDGRYLHRVGDPSAPASTGVIYTQPTRATKPKAKKTFPLPGKFREDAQHLNSTRNLKYWSELYCIPESSWIAIGAIGYENKLRIPEREFECLDRISAVTMRKKDGTKRTETGGIRGTTIAEIPNGKGHAVLIIEGGSDAATAHAAGFEPVSRYTRDADLTQLKIVLANVDDDNQIIVVVERDRPKEHDKWDGTDDAWVDELVNRACERAEHLANELGRPIIVTSPPQGANDLNDWWKQITHGQGHALTEGDRHEIGSAMNQRMIFTGKEVVPTADVMLAWREESSETFAEETQTRAEKQRMDALDRGYGDDADYDHIDSCSFFKSFERRTKEDDGTDFLFSHLSCNSWRCPACRERKVKPTWAIHLAHCFSQCDVIYRKVLVANGRDGLLAQRNLDRKQINRLGGTYVFIQQSETEAIIYSTTKPKGRVTRYPIRDYKKPFGYLLKNLAFDIEEIELQKGKPITTSAGWTRGQKSTIEDAIYKLTRISEIASNASETLSVTKMTHEAAKETLGAIRKRNSLLERECQTDFFAVSIPGGKNIVVLSSKSLTEKTVQLEPQKAVAGMTTSLMVATKQLSAETWTSAIRCTPRWTPKHSKRWRPLEVEISPSAAKSAAKQSGLHAVDLSYHATSATIVGVGVRVRDSMADQLSEFLESIDIHQGGKNVPDSLIDKNYI